MGFLLVVVGFFFCWFFFFCNFCSFPCKIKTFIQVMIRACWLCYQILTAYSSSPLEKYIHVNLLLHSFVVHMSMRRLEANMQELVLSSLDLDYRDLTQLVCQPSPGDPSGQPDYDKACLGEAD